jgi:hypothetical protein
LRQGEDEKVLGRYDLDPRLFLQVRWLYAKTIKSKRHPGSAEGQIVGLGRARH